MSAQPAYTAPLTAQRGGLAADLPMLPTRMTPAELPLTLPAAVLRLPYAPATRLVLAEIVSLHAANRGRCNCSDAHLAARLTISTDTANRAVKQLEADGLLVKEVDKAAGFLRTLTPVAAAIEAKAAANPYPENAGSYPQNTARGATRILPPDYPQNAGSPTRILPDPLPAKCGTNIPLINLPSNFHQSSSAACAVAADEKKIGAGIPVAEASTVEAEPGPTVASAGAPEPDRSAAAPKEKVAGKRKGPANPARSVRPEVPFLESELGTLEAFEAAFDGTDYALANLRYYHEKIAAWRQKGEVPCRKDWKATAKQFFLNDISANCLVLAPSVHYATGGGPADPGARAGGYRSRRYDA